MRGEARRPPAEARKRPLLTGVLRKTQGFGSPKAAQKTAGWNRDALDGGSPVQSSPKGSLKKKIRKKIRKKTRKNGIGRHWTGDPLFGATLKNITHKT
jgi:hypothetical protein